MHTNMIGHNNPPTDSEILATRLVEENAVIVAKVNELLSAADRIPEKFFDETDAQRGVDYVKLINSCKKTLEENRTYFKEPFIAQGRLVDTFFKSYDTQLNAALAKAKSPLDAFTKEKAEQERKRLQALEEQKRKEAEEIEAAALAASHNSTRAAEAVFQGALNAESQANKLAVSSQAKTGLTSVRSDTGATAALRSTWVGEIDDLSKLDLEAIRYMIPPAALQTALNAYIRAGGRELAGAKITEQTTTVVR